MTLIVCLCMCVLRRVKNLQHMILTNSDLFYDRVWNVEYSMHIRVTKVCVLAFHLRKHLVIIGVM